MMVSTQQQRSSKFSEGFRRINDEFILFYKFELPVGIREELSSVCCVFKAHEIEVREKYRIVGDRRVITEAYGYMGLSRVWRERIKWDSAQSPEEY